MAADGPLSGLRVLIAEDEYFVAQDIAGTLAAAGAHVIGPVATLAEAQALAQQPLDAAILDINLRGSAAYPLVDELVSRGVRQVFVTGYSASAIPDRFDHIPKCDKFSSANEFAAALFPERQQ